MKLSRFIEIAKEINLQDLFPEIILNDIEYDNDNYYCKLKQDYNEEICSGVIMRRITNQEIEVTDKYRVIRIYKKDKNSSYSPLCVDFIVEY